MFRKIALLALLLLIVAVPSVAQDRTDKWEGAAFVSAGKVGLNYQDISIDVREFVGPAYSFGTATSLMVGFSLNFTGTDERPAMVSAFIGGTAAQFIGVGYSFDLINQAVEKRIGFEKGRYKVNHSILFGALVRHPDLK